MAAHTAEVGTAPPALTLASISKRFGNTIALDGASFVLRRGTVHALLGENGAGKTTLMRIAFGLISPDSGVLHIDGSPRHFATPRDAIEAGIGMVHQHFMLVPAMTVAENIALGGHGSYNATQIANRVREVGTRHGLSVNPDAEVGTLTIGAQQRVEILKALTRDASILILDEPTAVLAPVEARALLNTMRSFVAGGGSVVLITHKLRDAIEFADDITVLRRGKTVYTTTAHSTTDSQLAAAMLGTTATVSGSAIVEANTERPTSTPVQVTFPVFRLHNVIVTDTRGVAKLTNVNLAVHAGEIVGIAAVEGNGQYELLRVLSRRLPPNAGTVDVPLDIGFVPEDRQRDALVLDFALYENVALPGTGTRRGTIAWNTERKATTQLIQDYDIRASGPDIPVRTLSGGNQQKLVIGRELKTAPHALVVENPTRGLDIQAAAAVHTRLREASRQGAAIVVYSSDVDEVLALARRIVVLYNGELHEVPHDRDVVGNTMVGRLS